jgi:hypothetical protein
MKRVLRTVLTCWLLVAVPLQGYAASVMLFCGTAHGSVDAVVVDHAAHGHTGHTHDDGLNGDRSPTLEASGLLHSGCSVCASCCSGAALPAATIATAFAQPHASPLLPNGHTAPDQAPARLERPPRTALA